jgi:hypothetical protein
MHGFHVSVIAPMAFAGLWALLLSSRVIDPPGWLIMTLSIAMVGDLVLSTCMGHLREFLETCGARFDRRRPFGQRPGNSRLWRVRQHEALSPLAGRRLAAPPDIQNSGETPDSQNDGQADGTETH